MNLFYCRNFPAEIIASMWMWSDIWEQNISGWTFRHGGHCTQSLGSGRITLRDLDPKKFIVKFLVNRASAGHLSVFLPDQCFPVPPLICSAGINRTDRKKLEIYQWHKKLNQRIFFVKSHKTINRSHMFIYSSPSWCPVTRSEKSHPQMFRPQISV
jgi:hypothetical protein